MNGSPRVISYSATALVLFTCAVTPFAAPMASAAPAKAQIIVLYDAFSNTPGMQKDWGYSALIQYAGKRILFDAGNNPNILEQNAKAKDIDLSKLDFVVMSHRHGDHMGGLAYLLKVNPTVKIYAPKEGFGVYGADLPSTFYRKDPSLPPEQRYYGARRRQLCDLGLPGPGRIFNWSTKKLRLSQTST
jgi:7,8-dihydropterin-6-yl-methyl-4-(beta-D-ribofuranosyl)aminobenzene 5'-phosphate synthase